MTIEELKQALEAATPGKWEQNGIAIGIGCHQEICLMAWPSNHPGDISEPLKNSKANARLIVEAVNNLPKLLKVVEAAQTMLDAIDKGAVDSEEIVPVPGDGPPYKFHEEWAHHARKALEELSNGK